MRYLLSLLVLSFSSSILAQDSWECQDYFSRDWNNILVVAIVKDEPNTGEITVSGVDYDTAYQVTGFNRRWDFGPTKEGIFTYSFVMAPNGEAKYYDFTGNKQSPPSLYFYCRQKAAQSHDKISQGGTD
jgi:hypothetical protein